MLLLAGCGSKTAATQRIERSFDVSWHDKASALALGYTTRDFRFHDGRWSARISVHNGTDEPLYEADWAPSESANPYFTWNGPAIVFNGLDVLGNRRLIYFPADHEEPALPYPLRPGQTWSGTIGGKLPARPALPKASPIWMRYPLFGLGKPWDNITTTDVVQWLSDKSVEL